MMDCRHHGSHFTIAYSTLASEYCAKIGCSRYHLLLAITNDDYNDLLIINVTVSAAAVEVLNLNLCVFYGLKC